MKRIDLSTIVKGRELALLMLVAVLVKVPLVCSAPSLPDAMAIEADPALRAAAPAIEALLYGSPADAPEARWRPLATLSVASDLELGDGGLLVLRLGNLLLLLAILVALQRLLRRHGLPPLPAALAALLVSLHPAFVPTLGTISGRATLLAMLAFLLANLFASRPTPGRRDRGAAFSFAILGGMAAPACAPLAAWPLVAAWAHGQPLDEAWRRARPMVVAMVLVLIAATLLMGRIGLAPEARAYDGTGLFGSLAAGLAQIGGAEIPVLLGPGAASPDPAAPGAEALGGGQALVGGLVLLASLLLAFRARLARQGRLALALAFLPLLLLPTTPILGGGALVRPADLLPVLLPFALPLGGGLALLLLRPRRPLRWALGLGIAALGLLSVIRCLPWRDPQLLLDSLRPEGPLAAIARAEAAAATSRDPRRSEREIIDAALADHPGEPRLLLERVRIELRPGGHANEAEGAIRALLADPRRIAGLQGLAGALAAATGDLGRARDHWQRGLADPSDGLSRYWLAQDAQRAGDLGLATRLYVEALDRARGPADQILALRSLHQLDYLRRQGGIGLDNLRVLCERQLGRAVRADDRQRLEAFRARLEEPKAP